ncbi:ABC transporter ATP-binding protein [Methylopila sp. Yamaguchi]|uniref:ABC transporter ATP-binding protein n=1 Tax=Methylopila sp. Yamaguchi TaxID=1437817 RepID=UPI000CC89A4D|nr:ABC transporter ATP-binding protein [Methylopila sp. Yamaguchi]GBD46926.1 spermidine/putrescine transport system ATP-binding protein [Methylopila sp. Yamaguchi]
MSYISLDGVSKQYGAAWAVDRVAMAIEKNEFVSLLGPSGSGKTTLLRIIAGLEKPTNGRVLIGGEDVTDLPPHKRGVAMVFQEFLLFPHRTVRENLAFPLRMLKLPKTEADERIDWVLGILSLRGLEGRYPNQLSGGQQQRVALGRGLVGRPKALLLDEPLANLDRELRQEMEVEIRKHQTALGIPFIYVTHNQEEALSMSDRIAVVRNGRIEDFAPRAEIYDRPKTAFIAQFVGRSNRFVGVLKREGATAAIDAGAVALATADRPELKDGAAVAAYVKNEKIRLRTPETLRALGANALAATVKHVILRGAYAEYVLTWAAGEMIASRPRAEVEFSAGDAVVAHWDPADVDVFPEKEAAA